MTDLVKQLVTGVVDSVLRDILKKAGVGTTKRKKRQARTATGRFKRTPRKVAKAPRKQVSRRRTVASRSKARQR